MTTRTRTEKLVVNSAQQSNAAKVVDTFWGYVIRPASPVIKRAAYGEMAASFAGVLLLMSAYGQWLLPGRVRDVEVFPFQVISTVVFFTFAMMLYLIARRGLCHEFQVDLQRNAVRTARRNRHGASSQTAIVAFDDISSVFIKRSASPWATSRMYVRTKKSQQLIDVVSGNEDDLTEILERLRADLTAHSSTVAEPQKSTAPVVKRRTTKPAPIRGAFAVR